MTDLAPGYSTTKQNPHIGNQPLTAPLHKVWSGEFSLGRVCYKLGLPSKEAAQLKDPGKDSSPTRGARQTGSRSWQEMTGGRWSVPEVPGAPKVIGSMGAKGWTSAGSETGKYL